MPITAPYTPDSYAGDGVTNAFTVTFQFQLPADLVVQTQLLSTNAITTLTLGTDYSVTPAQSPTQNSPANTGTVTLLTGALPAGTDLLISRAVPLTQLTTWVPNDPNPSTATMNAVDKLTMICQDLENEIENIQIAPQTGIVTTVVFSIAAVNASQSVTVNSTTGLYVGNNIQISNVINTMYGQITNITGLVLTVTTLVISSGLAGNNMPVNSPVQLASIPAGTATISLDDQALSLVVDTIHLGGSQASFNSSGVANVPMYLRDSGSGYYTITGYVARGSLSADAIASGVSNAGLVGWPNLSNFDNAQIIAASTNHSCLTYESALNPQLAFRLINAATTVLPSTIVPSLLHATNSPADTQVPSYNLATGNFTWINPNASGIPAGGNTSQFLRGDTTWSNVFRLDTGFGGLVFAFAETSTTPGLYLGANSPNVIPNGYTNNSLLASVVRGVSTWAYGTSGNHLALYGGLTIANGASPTVSPLLIDSTGATELLQVGKQSVPSSTNLDGIIRANGMRMGHGPWQFAYTISAPASSITVDLANGSYQRITSIANAVTITLADSTPAPSVGGWQFASVLTLEINSPGSNVFTWPGTVTWANGGSAPNLSTTGINLVRLVRRQGQTQWVGYVENNTFALTPGIINATNLFASQVVPIAALVGTGTPSSTTYLRGDGSWNTPSGAILATNLGSSISGGPFTTINFVSTTGATLTGSNGGGGVLNVSVSGSGGGGQSPIQLQNNGVNYGAAGAFTAYNLQAFSGGPLNMAFAGSVPTAGVTSAYGWYNVKFYGAVGNGVTDDLAAINAAISAASANGGGTVYFPAGTYIISNTINLVSAVSLHGDGSGRRNPGSPDVLNYATRIKCGAGFSATSMVSGAGNIGGLTIIGIYFFGNSLAAKGLYFESLSHSLIQSCSVEGTTSICMHLYPQSGQDGCTNNKFDNLYLVGQASQCGIKIDAAVLSVNACHNHFSNLFITAGNYAVDIGWSDNNTWTQVYCFHVGGAIVSQDVHLRSQVGALGAGAFATSQYFFHLEGTVLVDASVAGNFIYCYDKANGQADPVVGAGGLLMWTSMSSTAMGTFFNNGTAVSGVEYNFSLGDACLLSPGLNSGNPVKFSRINFT